MTGLIDKKFHNITDLGDIMNVVLQGVSKTDNKEIYELGMKIYERYNTVKVVHEESNMDRAPKTYLIPETKVK